MGLQRARVLVLSVCLFVCLSEQFIFLKEGKQLEINIWLVCTSCTAALKFLVMVCLTLRVSLELKAIITILLKKSEGTKENHSGLITQRVKSESLAKILCFWSRYLLVKIIPELSIGGNMWKSSLPSIRGLSTRHTFCKNNGGGH